MRCYRLHLQQTSGATTPWHSDTLWGQLCWIFRDWYGEQQLTQLLEEAKEGNIPFVVSDGFPKDFLPMPVNAMSLFPYPAARNKAEGIRQIETAKAFKKLKYLHKDFFEQAIKGKDLPSQEIICSSPPPKNHNTMQTRNAINRETNTVQDEHLYQTPWLMTGDGNLDLYVLVQENFENIFWTCFDALEKQGFGGDLSIGMGAFKRIETEALTLPKAQEPNCFITLSHCTPSPDMPVNGQYNLRVKYGKLGHERSRQGSPFKKPVIQCKPGAVFWGVPAKEYCGCLVDNVAFDSEYGGTVQCGLSIIVPALMPEGGI